MGRNSKALRAGQAVIEFSLEDQQLSRRLNNLTSRFSQFGAKISRIGAFGIGRGGLGGFVSLFAGAAGLRALMWPIRLAANLETVDAQFTAITGSASEAKRIIAELEEFSQRSIVPLNDLEKAAQILLGYGTSTEDVVPAVKALTAVARGNAVWLDRLSLAYGQTQAKQRLYAQEVRQFTEAGFNPLQAIAERTGETLLQVSDRMSDGAVSSQEVTQALIDATTAGGRFGQILEQVSKTATGIWSIFKTRFMLAIRPLGQAFLPLLKSIGSEVNSMLPSIAEIIKKNAAWYATILTLIGAVGGMMVGLIGIGLALKVAAVAFGTLMSAALLAKTVVFGLFLVAASKAGIFLLALTQIITAFFHYTSAGKSWLKSMKNAMSSSYHIFSATFHAISKALQAGELKLAFDVMMKAIVLVFTENTQTLRDLWIEFKDFFLRTTTEFVFDFQVIFLQAINRVKSWLSEFNRFWADALDLIITEIAKIGESEGVQNQLDQALYGKINAREAEAKKRRRELIEEEKKALEDLEAARTEASRQRDREFNEEIEKHTSALDEARQAWQDARAAALAASLEVADAIEARRTALNGRLPNAGNSLARSSGTFSGRFSRQQFASLPTSVEKEQLEVLEDIRDNGIEQNQILEENLGFEGVSK